MLQLQNISIYRVPDKLYVTTGDHFLLEIAGEQIVDIETILGNLTSPKTSSHLFEDVKEKFENNHEYFLSLLDWLKQNKIISEESINSEIEKKEYKVIVYGHLNDEDAEQMMDILESNWCKYNCIKVITEDIPFDNDTISQADFVLLCEPIFSSHETALRLNKICYAEKIPFILVTLESETLTLGPAFNPKLGTPCLSCYMKRKMANMANPQDYLRFIKYGSNKQQVAHLSLSKSKYFRVALELLKIELDSLNFLKWESGGTIGKTQVFDFLNRSVSLTKLLRVHECEVCSNIHHYVPLNG